MVQRRTIDVWADWPSLGAAVPMGKLHATPTRGREVFSFEYDGEWLQRRDARALDPALVLFQGPQYPAAERESWGVFLDSAPDRWGRVLMQRREAVLAREERRSPRRLTEVDYLLGVYDGHRMGGLRYRIGDGPFLDDNETLASPPWTSLPELEQVSLRLENEDAESDPDYARWVRLLIAPGRSLGGARPKASVVDRERNLWIAKFPSASDTTDIGAWEQVAHKLARKAAIDVSDARIERFGSRHHTFLAKRFDRIGEGRIHFASAMTLLNKIDGVEGVSYMDLALVLIRQGAKTAADLEQLWRRILFNVCVSNVDDHLRNHGFLLDDRGWRLAPAYDLNPVADGNGLTLNINETDNSQDLDLVLEVAAHFRVKRTRATKIRNEVLAAVRTWEQEAMAIGLSRTACEAMRPAFRLTE